jgi:predicted O-methyltransferase YrrM
MRRGLLLILSFALGGLSVAALLRRPVSSVAAAPRPDEVNSLSRLLALNTNSRKSPDQLIAALPEPFHKALASMYGHQPQTGTDGVKHELSKDTGVWASDGMWIYNLIRQSKAEHTLEVGLAEGYSTLFMLAALSENGGKGTHTALDPFETSDWNGIGLRKIEDTGMQSRFVFVPEKSLYALPRLAAERKSYQVIFIDGDHRFDAQMLDFVMADNLLDKGGYLLFHDTWMESTQKLMAFLVNNRPDYTAIPTGTNLAAFRKTGADGRDWKAFTAF